MSCRSPFCVAQPLLLTAVLVLPLLAQPAAGMKYAALAAYVSRRVAKDVPKSAVADRAALAMAKMITTKTGLKYLDEKEGTGKTAKAGNTFTVHYTGWLKDGKKFDSSRDRGRPFSSQLGTGRVIKGFDEGIAGMKEGGKRKLIIPSELAYGKRGAGNVIPPDAELTFEVELLKVTE